MFSIELLNITSLYSFLFWLCTSSGGGVQQVEGVQQAACCDCKRLGGSSPGCRGGSPYTLNWPEHRKTQISGFMPRVVVSIMQSQYEFSKTVTSNIETESSGCRCGVQIMEWRRIRGLNNPYRWCQHCHWRKADSRFHWERNPLVILNAWHASLALCQ